MGRQSDDFRLHAAADSTGQRNRFAEHLSGRPEAERLARPLVQLSRDRVELQLGVARDVDALWHVLPEQPVRVLVTFGTEPIKKG